MGSDPSLLAAWGDPLGGSRFGFNNDHLGFVQHDGETASMTVNFEYISAVPWVRVSRRWLATRCCTQSW